MALLYANDFAALANVQDITGGGFDRIITSLSTAQRYALGLRALGLQAPTVSNVFFNSNQQYWCPVFWATTYLGSPVSGLLLEGMTASTFTVQGRLDEYGRNLPRARQFSLPLKYTGDELYVSLCMTSLLSFDNSQGFLDPTYVPEFIQIGYDYITLNQDKTISVNGINTGAIGAYYRGQPVKQQYNIKVTKNRLVVKLDGVTIADQPRDETVPMPEILSICASRADGSGSHCHISFIVHSAVVYDNSGTTLNTERKRIRAKSFVPTRIADSIETQTAGGIGGLIAIDVPVQEMNDTATQQSTGGYYLGTAADLKNTWSITKPAVPGAIVSMALLFQSRYDEPGGNGFTAVPFVNIGGTEHVYEGKPVRATWGAQIYDLTDLVDFSFTSFKVGYRTGYVNLQPLAVQGPDNIQTYAYPVILPQKLQPWIDGSAITYTKVDVSNYAYKAEGDGWLGNKQTANYQQILNTSYKQDQ